MTLKHIIDCASSVVIEELEVNLAENQEISNQYVSLPFLEDGNAIDGDDSCVVVHTHTSTSPAGLLATTTCGSKSTTTRTENDDCTTLHHHHQQQQKLQLPRYCSRYHVPPSQCVAFTISNVLSSTECQMLIQLAEKVNNNFQYVTEATHVASDGSSYRVPIQNPNPHKLSVLHHPQTISMLWKRLQPVIQSDIFLHLPSYQRRMNCGMPVGLNPRIRILRYDATDNDRFEPHFDATTYIDTQQQHQEAEQQQQLKQKSLLTVLIYLNSGGGVDFSGGETCYLDSHISTTSSLSVTTNHGKEPNIVTPTNSVTTKVIAETGKVVIFEHDLYHSGAPLISGTKYVLRTDVMFLHNSEYTHEVKQLQHGAQERTDNNVEFGPSKEQTASMSLLSSTSTANLVIDLCHSLKFSEEDVAFLDGMCMLDMTIENLFSSITISSVKSILNESGIPRETVNQFVNIGLKILQTSKV
jgi:hypothetical protein